MTMRRIIIGMLLIVVFGLAARTIYERIGQRRDNDRLPVIGQRVDIGGRSINVHCIGAGSPTVILDSGGSAPGYSNVPLQRRIAKETRTCWFDRAGLGWSDPSPIAQTSAAIAADLHSALSAAKIAPPYILVGQSFSGFNVRLFARSFPGEVAGIVLADSVHEDQRQYEPRSTLAPANRLPPLFRAIVCRAAPLAKNVGLIRLMVSGENSRISEGFSKEEAQILHRLEAQPKAVATAASCNVWEKSAAEARLAGHLGDIPMVVLTAGNPMSFGDPTADEEIRIFHEIWVRQLQPKLAALSSRGRQVIVANTSHSIVGEMPSAIADAIRPWLSGSER
jgi:pimeloyl-ACP methyl ester carboxylesterase